MVFNFSLSEKESFEEALSLYHQGIQLLKNNNNNNSTSSNNKQQITNSFKNDSNQSNVGMSKEKRVSIANPEESKSNSITSSTQNECEHENKWNDNLNVPSSGAVIGYCIDSVEPKCNELKRLIDELKVEYANKLDTFKNKKELVHKLNSVSRTSLLTFMRNLIYIFLYYL